MELMVMEPELLLVTVTVFGALVAPIPVAENVKVAGLKVRGTVAPPVAAPESATVSGLNAPLVVMARAPLMEPLYRGAKVTVMVQLAAALIEDPQVPPVTE
jgi:hypothetical protein